MGEFLRNNWFVVVIAVILISFIGYFIFDANRYNVSGKTMDGKEVFKFAVNALTQAAENVMEQAGVTSADIDWLLPHQANARIIENVGKKLNLPDEKVIVTIDHTANTSAATIPVALSEEIANGHIKKGDLVVLTAMGAGFTWGGALVRI